MRAADTGVPLNRARVSPIHQRPRTSWIRSIASVSSRPGSMRARANGTTAPRDLPTCAPAISSCFGAPAEEGGKTCRARTTRDRAMRSSVARPTPSVRWLRQRPARCQVGVHRRRPPRDVSVPPANAALTTPYLQYQPSFSPMNVSSTMTELTWTNWTLPPEKPNDAPTRRPRWTSPTRAGGPRRRVHLESLGCGHTAQCFCVGRGRAGSVWAWTWTRQSSRQQSRLN
jgi:hypothetical protein